jgi:hypothetical protein
MKRVKVGSSKIVELMIVMIAVRDVPLTAIAVTSYIKYNGN